MTRQLDLFGGPVRKGERRVPPIEELVARAKGEERELVRVLKSAEKGGRVNGMSKAALRRYAPPKLPKVTLP